MNQITSWSWSRRSVRAARLRDR